MRGKLKRIINCVKSKIAEIETAEIEECLYCHANRNAPLETISTHSDIHLRSLLGPYSKTRKRKKKKET